MSTNNNGGPAFPAQPIEHVSPGVTIECQSGMTLRDYFAAKAMQGWLASWPESTAHPASVDSAEQLAMRSYQVADAMLKAREE